ncbi:tropomodulin-1-like [Styela clava]|uniref:tropomodulin-1-like n=1 Tax=Styela clava TaxID=7725 RepID=UPI001939780D|nr:tropomodulin-1-like [Styela clava]
MTDYTDMQMKEREKYLALDEDELLAGLNEDELEQLELELEELDPDNELLPAGMRQKDQTKKKATGKLNREELMDFLESEAKLIEDVEETVPYQPGVKRGKVFVQQESVEGVLRPANLDPELEEALDNASEAELTDIAAILGMHTLMSSDQFYSSIKSSKIANQSGFTSVTKCDLKVSPINEPPNPTDVDKTLKLCQEDDAELTDINLNNIKNIPIHTLKAYCEALKTNTHVISFSLVNTRSNDAVAGAIGDMLKINRVLKILNVESNFMSGDGLQSILKCLTENDCIEQLRVDNQRSQFGNKVEMEMADFITQSSTLLKFGYNFRLQGPRSIVAAHLLKNNDAKRLTRVEFNPSSVVTKTVYKKKK